MPSKNKPNSLIVLNKFFANYFDSSIDFLRRGYTKYTYTSINGVFNVFFSTIGPFIE